MKAKRKVKVVSMIVTVVTVAHRGLNPRKKLHRKSTNTIIIVTNITIINMEKGAVRKTPNIKLHQANMC